MIDTTLANKFAGLALAHVRREYPNKLDHVMNGPNDVRPPRELHPIFYGSFDWHSNVHGYWLLATLYRRIDGLEQRDAIRTLFDEQLTESKVAAERAYLTQPSRANFERPYGWAWMLMLAAELSRHDTDDGQRWSVAVAPLAKDFAALFRGFLPKATYPIRVGTHFNSAFALALAIEYARTLNDSGLESLIVERCTTWFGNDVGCQAWEPSGDDFLSSALMEAECMRRVLGDAAWQPWVDRFLPDIARSEPATLFLPATVSDRSDGKIAHLDGLNLTRAWCWRSMASSWPRNDPRRAVALQAANRHVEASLPHVAGDYAGEHWMATFALLALDAAVQ